MATAKGQPLLLTNPVSGPLATPPEPVKQFGKYFLVRKLAEGGMAEIFLAKLVGAEGFERDVVIKRMLKHLSAVNDFVNMFLDEAKLAARLVHPNVIQINELGLADGCYFICMEYLPGEDFSTVIRTAGRKREYVPLTVVARVMADAAHGLSYAHEFTDSSGKPLGIVHRDISPSNIYVTYQGQVKVLDFGIAKAESRLTNTTAGVVKGKYMYMAPEQARGVPVDRRADVFSLGVSLYEAVTHYRPFSRENDLAILNAVLKCDFKPPRELRKDLPAELETIILKAMSAKPDDRYSSASAMAQDLERFIGSVSTASGATQAGTYLRSLFGEERVAHRTRIPSLIDLAQAGVPVPGFNPEAKTLAAPRPGQSDPAVPRYAQGASALEATANPDKTAMAAAGEAGQHRKSGAGLLAVGVLLGLIAFGGAFAALRFWPGSQPQPPPPLVNPTVTPPVAVNPPAPVNPPPPDNTTLPPDESTKLPDPPPDNSTVKPPVVKHTPVQTAPVQLDAVSIQRVVNRSYGPINQCFETYKAELPTEKGQVSVRFTILQSGKVTGAQTVGNLAGSHVATCLEQRVTHFQFPRHVDKEITLSAPFQYQVKR
ncbi:MAG TPA: protein kinase [Myxococcaceae bacterium]|nr:protein kinase [Myxococcaceae bacterium]